MKVNPKNAKLLSDQEQVAALIQQLHPQLGKIVQHIRKVILRTDRRIGERIMWNNRGFYYTGKMKAIETTGFRVTPN